MIDPETKLYFVVIDINCCYGILYNSEYVLLSYTTIN